jgi:superfamily II DNA helicase RecQ
MEDQVAALTARGIRAAMLGSAQSSAEVRTLAELAQCNSCSSSSKTVAQSMLFVCQTTSMRSLSICSNNSNMILRQ